MKSTVFVVEDNPITRKVVELTLSGEGYRVVMAESASQAIERIVTCAPDLVLQDLALDDMSGIELLGRLRVRVPARVPFVAFTSNSDEHALRAAGFDDVLVKPVTPSELARVVHEHLHGRPREAVTSRTGLHAWSALTAMLSDLTRLAGKVLPAPALQADVLASLLHASGLSLGFAYGVDADGTLVPHARLGFSSDTGPGLARAWALQPEILAAHTSGLVTAIRRADSPSAALLDRTGARSMLLVPLSIAERRIGLLVLASINAEISAEWLDVGPVIAGPIAHVLDLAATVARLSSAEHKFRGIAESTGDGLVVTTAAGEISYSNSAAQRILGASAIELAGRSIIGVLPHVGSGLHSGTVTQPSGNLVEIETTVRSFEETPGQLSWVHAIRDVSERKRLEGLAALANRDPVTGLANRRRFDEFLASRLAAARRYGTAGAVVLIDLDHFKKINDTHGHAIGDRVLQVVASLLEANTRESDLVARLGGDELALVLDHADTAGAQLCARKLLELFEDLRVPCGLEDLHIAASIGYASFPEHGPTALELLAAADAALYRAKSAGRACARPAEGKAS